MSSVVNKSGVRFTPKTRQRRLLTTARTVQPSIVANEERSQADKSGDGNENEDTAVETRETVSQNAHDASADEDEGDEEDEDDNDTYVADTKLGPLEKLDGTHINAKLKVPSTVSSSSRRRHSSRLDSLGGATSAKPLFKPGFNEPSIGNDGRRLSTISNSTTRKVRLSSISEKDVALQALKRSRMSARTSISKKSGSAHRISIVSRMSSPDANVHTATAVPKSEGKKESSADLFQRTDSLYEKYTIKNLQEIPKNIQDFDSNRYTLDEEEFTMAELCKPKLPIGEPSENFERAKQACKAKIEKRKLRRELRHKARLEFKSLKSLRKEEQEKELEERKKATEKLLNSDVPESQGSHAAIQLKMGPDGKLIVDEDSTVVDRHKNASMENAHKQKLDENPFENLYNSATYGRNAYTDPWTTEELIKFYKALSMWGTDFNLIAQLFPYRTRKQVKAKFVNEERKHTIIVELALQSKLPPDFEQYCIDTKKEIGTVSEFNERLNELKVKHEEHLRAIDAAKANAKEEDLKSFKLSDGDDSKKKTSGGFTRDQLKVYRKSEIVLGTIEEKRKQAIKEAEEYAMG
ncbi:hypothetical protein HG535_0D02080 [Zygotorulaspora mrakii]|uniref:SANT domain-containing protein n=1 Tax=Zygotorulaspora mrakii TaxID=42260 RepID=A0A7H9B1J6_ZYGMR|nr:uncharacterized protein HG535_0D02080 [Zygotorulaspora mrakii]QLG72500.1 hypothetical protein HG535_0D02080 [Zygotorulaspora mrakii]